MAKEKSGPISEELGDLVGKAVRPDQRLKAEDLVASELATAILSEPLSKIRHICESLMILSDDERKSAGITEEEAEEALEKIYPLCQTLQNVFVDKFVDKFGNVLEKSATISWPFTRREAPEWLRWMRHSFWKIYPGDEEYEKILEEAQKLHEEGKEHESLYHVTTERVTIDTVNRVKIQFIDYAMPKSAKLMKKIMRLVSSSSFQEALKRLKGGSYASARG